MNRKAKLMIVDNEIDICNFVKAFFETRGYSVATAYHGDEAMAKLEKERPDIVMLDVMMRRPGEGLEYLPRIKAALPSVKVLMITGVDDRDIIERARELGADDYITKPLILEYLDSTVLEKVKTLKKEVAA